jgi:hypothetical protein
MDSCLNDEAITQYILDRFVLPGAAVWNKRIEKYLEREHD